MDNEKNESYINYGLSLVITNLDSEVVEPGVCNLSIIPPHFSRGIRSSLIFDFFLTPEVSSTLTIKRKSIPAHVLAHTRAVTCTWNVSVSFAQILGLSTPQVTRLRGGRTVCPGLALQRIIPRNKARLKARILNHPRLYILKENDLFICGGRIQRVQSSDKYFGGLWKTQSPLSQGWGRRGKFPYNYMRGHYSKYVTTGRPWKATNQNGCSTIKHILQSWISHLDTSMFIGQLRLS